MGLGGKNAWVRNAPVPASRLSAPARGSRGAEKKARFWITANLDRKSRYGLTCDVDDDDNDIGEPATRVLRMSLDPVLGTGVETESLLF